MKRLRLGLILILFFTALYDFAWPTPTIHYYVFVVLHLAAGIAFLFLLFCFFGNIWRNSTLADRAGWSLLALGGVIGLALIFTGTPRNDFPILYVHIIASLVGVILLLGSYANRRKWLALLGSASPLRWAVILVVFAALSYGAWWTRSVQWQRSYQITNPVIAPATMNQEGAGSSGPYFP
ncbi:MAG TPA: hypothetical protein VKT50_12725, partial [Candidatus Acidoferrales bacterium]|nr:hypothetical protein [Candidatus Acidoferrales bacterium]